MFARAEEDVAIASRGSSMESEEQESSEEEEDEEEEEEVIQVDESDGLLAGMHGRELSSKRKRRTLKFFSASLFCCCLVFLVGLSLAWHWTEKEQKEQREQEEQQKELQKKKQKELEEQLKAQEMGGKQCYKACSDRYDQIEICTGTMKYNSWYRGGCAFNGSEKQCFDSCDAANYTGNVSLKSWSWEFQNEGESEIATCKYGCQRRRADHIKEIELCQHGAPPRYKKDFPAAGDSTHAPKIIWAFWGQRRLLCNVTAPCPMPCLSKKAPMPSIVELSIDSWKKMNPDYDIRVLDEDNVWNYLSREELPRAYECLDSAHTSDAIRIALLVKFGGVWIDATAVMLKPLKEFLGDIRHPTTYIVPRFVNASEFYPYVENYFFADRPNGKILPAVKDCVWQFYEHEGYSNLGWHPAFAPRASCPDIREAFGDPDQYFSKKTLVKLKNFGLTPYLEMHACFLKVYDEQPDIREWWDSDAVIKADENRSVYPEMLKGYDPEEYAPYLLNEVDTDLADQVLNYSWMLKMSTSVLKVAGHKDLYHLRCDNSTLNLVLQKAGLITADDCAKERAKL